MTDDEIQLKKLDMLMTAMETVEVDLEDVLHIYSVLGYIVNQSGEFRLIKP